jgi:hypothetical protein
MDNDKSLLEKITDTVKGIATVAADAASHALKAEEPPLKADETAVTYMPLAADGLVSDGAADRGGTAPEDETRGGETDGQEEDRQESRQESCDERREKVGQKISQESSEKVHGQEVKEGRQKDREESQQESRKEGGEENAQNKARKKVVQRPSFFDTRNFNSSTFDNRNFSSGGVLASLQPITRSIIGGVPRIGRLTTVFGSKFCA